MGLFSGISKAFKSVTKGIKKAFGSIVEAGKKLVGGVVKTIDRISKSKWGKALLVGAALFTGAMAVSGAVQGWTAASQMQGATFMSKFVGGAKGFMTALTSPIQQAKSLMGGVEGAAAAGQSLSGAAAKMGSGAAQTAQAGIEAAAGIPGVGTAVAPPSQLAAGGALQAGSVAQQLAGPGALSQAAAQTAGQTAAQTAAGAAGGGNWLTKAAQFGKEFIMSPAGGYLIQGIGAGMAKEEELEMQYEHEDRYRRAWEDPNNALAQLTRSSGFGSINVPGGTPPVPIFNPGGPVNLPGTQTTRGAPMPGEPMPVGG